MNRKNVSYGLGIAIAVAAACVAIPARSLAMGDHADSSVISHERHRPRDGDQPVSAPEIPGGLLADVLAVVGAGFLIFKDRRRPGR